MDKTEHEDWLSLEDFPAYAVSTEGRVRRRPRFGADGRLRRSYILEPGLLSNPRAAENRKSSGSYVRLVRGDTVVRASVADLVYETFVEKYDRRFNLMAFKDSNPDNPRLSNLYLIPRSRTSPYGSDLRAALGASPTLFQSFQ